jgi:hypothetical protein
VDKKTGGPAKAESKRGKSDSSSKNLFDDTERDRLREQKMIAMQKSCGRRLMLRLVFCLCPWTMLAPEPELDVRGSSTSSMSLGSVEMASLGGNDIATPKTQKKMQPTPPKAKQKSEAALEPNMKVVNPELSQAIARRALGGGVEMVSVGVAKNAPTNAPRPPPRAPPKPQPAAPVAKVAPLNAPRPPPRAPLRR